MSIDTKVWRAMREYAKGYIQYRLSREGLVAQTSCPLTPGPRRPYDLRTSALEAASLAAITPVAGETAFQYGATGAPVSQLGVKVRVRYDLDDVAGLEDRLVAGLVALWTVSDCTFPDDYAGLDAWEAGWAASPVPKLMERLALLFPERLAARVRVLGDVAQKQVSADAREVLWTLRPEQQRYELRALEGENAVSLVGLLPVGVVFCL